MKIFGRIASGVLALLLSACAFPTLPLGRVAEAPTAAPQAAAVAGAATGAGPLFLDSTPTAGTTGTPAAGTFNPGAEGLHQVVLFTSTATQPLAQPESEALQLPYAERHVWAIALDGQQGGRLSPAGFGAAIGLPGRAGAKPRLLDYGLTAKPNSLEIVAPPEECAAAENLPFDPANPPCGGFQFSADGRFLAYYTGPEACGRTLTVFDLDSRQPLRSFPNTHWAYFQQDSSLMLAAGACDAAKAGLYIPHKDTYAGTGLDGVPSWNLTGTAVLFQVQAIPAVRAALWGFNLQTSKIFMWMDDASFMENQPNWTPDGETFLFQHRKVRFDQSANLFTLDGPQQILRMSAKTRSQSLLAYSGGYDYHLCSRDGQPCDQWYGDWIQVTRTRFHPQTFAVDPTTGLPKDTPEARCAFQGQDCPEPAAEFALNWRTGELRPWAEAGIGDAPTSAVPAGPDRAAVPVYSDPAGLFALYPGLDGHSLWSITLDQEPVQLVKDGENFVYVP